MTFLELCDMRNLPDTCIDGWQCTMLWIHFGRNNDEFKFCDTCKERYGDKSQDGESHDN